MIRPAFSEDDWPQLLDERGKRGEPGSLHLRADAGVHYTTAVVVMDAGDFERLRRLAYGQKMEPGDWTWLEKNLERPK